MQSDVLFMTADKFTEDEMLIIKRKIRKQLMKGEKVKEENEQVSNLKCDMQTAPQHQNGTEWSNGSPTLIHKFVKGRASGESSTAAEPVCAAGCQQVDRKTGDNSRHSKMNGISAGINLKPSRCCGDDNISKSVAIPRRMKRLLNPNHKSGAVKRAKTPSETEADNAQQFIRSNGNCPASHNGSKSHTEDVLKYDSPGIYCNSYLPSGDVRPEVVALDCEFVGVGLRKLSALGRCSIVDYHGEVILDIYSKPKETITDYRTKWSGLRPRDLRNAVSFATARKQIEECIQDKIVVGHAVHHDFQVLSLFPPRELVRDTSTCPQLTRMAELKGRHVGLKKLTAQLLGRSIQVGEHSSVEDARACMDLYRLVEQSWEEEHTKSQTQIINKKTAQTFLQDSFWPDDL